MLPDLCVRNLINRNAGIVSLDKALFAVKGLPRPRILGNDIACAEYSCKQR